MDKLSKIKGILIEDKHLSLSVHYRSVDPADIGQLKRLIHEITRPYLITDEVKLGTGKKVIEITPFSEWDKGKLVLWLFNRQQLILGDTVLPVYIGDDRMDESAFKSLTGIGLTIFVGEPKKIFHARYYLKDTQETVGFLRQVLELKTYL